jgi:hypothetical protein
VQRPFGGTTLTSTSVDAHWTASDPLTQWRNGAAMIACLAEEAMVAGLGVVVPDLAQPHRLRVS